MTDRRMDRLIRELAADYNRPPETPREEIWAGLEDRLFVVETAERRPDRPGVHRLEPGPARRTGPGAPWFAWASAAAAVLVLGIGIGRLTAPEAGPASGAREGSGAALSGGASRGPAVALDPGAESPVHGAAVRHLGRSESLLSLVRADAGEGRVDPAVGRWARGLLLETRLLLDAPVSSDPELGRLLEDLELILAQVVVLEDGDGVDGSRGREELRLIADGLRERDVLTRIRTVLSQSGPATL